MTTESFISKAVMGKWTEIHTSDRTIANILLLYEPYFDDDATVYVFDWPDAKEGQIDLLENIINFSKNTDDQFAINITGAHYLIYIDILETWK